ncbi:hypothetical protein GT755_30105 [Herbidospora sp. NEAU-GS84]|uniref:Uncharacterized protein n=1 Tax=Herbidospora solisilvae TaxID=2696284 RepID=A0A7C9JZL3_9ACTN|nr:hypothetical protein [Herbidospora solisilvae]NAS25919.1 hypothetical protein [Herbidospora solisilvae]
MELKLLPRQAMFALVAIFRRRGLPAVVGVIGAVEGELAQRGGLRLDAVRPREVGRRASDLDVVRLGPLSDSLVLFGGQVRADVVPDDRDAALGGQRLRR